MKSRDEIASEALRDELAAAGGTAKARGSGYPMALRARVVQHATRCRERGEGMPRIASRLGISATTLKSWLRAGAPGPAFAPVEIVDRGVVVLVSPAGWRAEIDLQTFAALVARTT